MDQKFTKAEKLKREKLIKMLFSKGKRLKAYPINLVYVRTDLPENVAVQAGFSVPKRNHKTAVVRNRLKRLMRESFRRYKNDFYKENAHYAFMFIYNGKHKASYGEIEKVLVKLTKQFKEIESRPE